MHDDPELLPHASPAGLLGLGRTVRKPGGSQAIASRHPSNWLTKFASNTCLGAQKLFKHTCELCLDAWDTVAQLITYEATSAALFKALQQSVQERAEEMGGGQSAAANTASIDEVISSNAASLQPAKLQIQLFRWHLC